MGNYEVTLQETANYTFVSVEEGIELFCVPFSGIFLIYSQYQLLWTSMPFLNSDWICCNVFN